MTGNIKDELEKINTRLGLVNSRLGKIEKRQDKTETDIAELREDRLGQREMLGAIAQGLDRIHERLGPMQDVYKEIPAVLGSLEAKLDSAIKKLDERPCLVDGACNVGGK
jgi:DNA anti-recombination protein RmuC